MHVIKSEKQANTATPIALYDASHGQANWAQTGFPSRELHTNFAALTETLCRSGCECRSTNGQPLISLLRDARLLVIPPPTGRYDVRKERWRQDRSSLFTPAEVCAILKFLDAGGRLLAFAYRFGDSFTQTNLGDLSLALGCRLNDDAVIDVRALRRADPLHLCFDTPADSIPPAWASAGVASVAWRPVATFAILPGAATRPLTLSTGGGCLSFDRTLRRICFASLPIAVAGSHGAGRFAIFGGPHLFESNPLGLLPRPGNSRFLRNVLNWLLGDAEPGGEAPSRSAVGASEVYFPDLCRVEESDTGERTITTVERALRKAGVLKALSRAKWLP
jgi:hypothetical protein